MHALVQGIRLIKHHPFLSFWDRALFENRRNVPGKYRRWLENRSYAMPGRKAPQFGIPPVSRQTDSRRWTRLQFADRFRSTRRKSETAFSASGSQIRRHAKCVCVFDEVNHDGYSMTRTGGFYECRTETRERRTFGDGDMIEQNNIFTTPDAAIPPASAEPAENPPETAAGQSQDQHHRKGRAHPLREADSRRWNRER